MQMKKTQQEIKKKPFIIAVNRAVYMKVKL